MSPYYEGIMKHACKKAYIPAHVYQERVTGCELDILCIKDGKEKSCFFL
jgi:hypothetical protein